MNQRRRDGMKHGPGRWEVGRRWEAVGLGGMGRPTSGRMWVVLVSDAVWLRDWRMERFKFRAIGPLWKLQRTSMGRV